IQLYFFPKNDYFHPTHMSKTKHMKLYRLFLFIVLATPWCSYAQETFPVNGAPDHREHYYFLEGATIHVNPDEPIENGNILIHHGKIIAIGRNIEKPNDAILKDVTGSHIYPSFIDLSTTYGIPEALEQGSRPNQQVFTSGKPGAFSWNESLIPEYEASSEFHHDQKEATQYRRIGFGTVLTHRKNGILR